MSARYLYTDSGVFPLGILRDRQFVQRNGSSVEGIAPPFSCTGRLTLTTGIPVTTTDVLAATTVYFTPLHHDDISLYTGNDWARYAFTEKSIKLTDAQTGTTHNGTKIIDGLADTSQFVRGMAITGTNVGAASVIATVDSATQITGTVNSTGDGTNTITFKIPASKNVDIFGVLVSGNLALRFGNFWTSDTARNDALGSQNGYGNVNNAAISSGDSNSVAAKTGLYLGTVRTTATAGQTEDSLANANVSHRFLWNAYNRVPRTIQANPGGNDNSANTTYTVGAVATLAEANGGTGSKLDFVLGLAIEPVIYNFSIGIQNDASSQGAGGVGEDSTTTAQCAVYLLGASQLSGPANGRTVNFAVGYHYLDLLVCNATAAGTAAFYADFVRLGGGRDPRVSIIQGVVWA